MKSLLKGLEYIGRLFRGRLFRGAPLPAGSELRLPGDGGGGLTLPGDGGGGIRVPGDGGGEQRLRGPNVEVNFVYFAGRHQRIVVDVEGSDDMSAWTCELTWRRSKDGWVALRLTGTVDASARTVTFDPTTDATKSVPEGPYEHTVWRTEAPAGDEYVNYGTVTVRRRPRL